MPAHPKATLALGHKARATLEIGHRARAWASFVESPSGILRVEPEALRGTGGAGVSSGGGGLADGLLSSLAALGETKARAAGRFRDGVPLRSAGSTPISAWISSGGPSLSAELTSQWAPTVLRVGTGTGARVSSGGGGLADGGGRLGYSPVRQGGIGSFSLYKPLVDATTHDEDDDQ